MAARQTGRNGG